MADDVPPNDLDRALATATQRTVELQEHVDAVIEEGLVPPRPVIEDVVQRSEDVSDLAHEARERQEQPE
jgi:hypothetical protein